MIEAALVLHDAATPVLSQLFAVFLRIGGLMLLMPGLGSQLIPTRVRLVVALSLSAAIAPSVPVAAEVTLGLVLVETTIGLALGGALRFIATALSMAGMMAAQLTSLAQLFGSVEPSSAMGNLLNIAGLALIMASGLPLMLIDLLIRSYDVLPQGLPMPGSDVAMWGVT